MAKNENIEFLESVCPPTVKDRSYDGLLTWLFGSEERTIAICCRVAYRDVQRNLRGIGKMPEQYKKAWREDIEQLITRCIDELFTLNLSSQEIFDTWHRNVCEKICEMSNKHNVSEWLENEYTYGLSQKILNMTIKNMLVMEQWDNIIEPIKKYLHVPVDSYVLEAAYKMLDIKIIDKQGQFKPYKEGDTKPWSKWNYDNYIGFQNELRKTVDFPMTWEIEAWNKTKDERKKQS